MSKHLEELCDLGFAIYDYETARVRAQELRQAFIDNDEDRFRWWKHRDAEKTILCPSCKDAFLRKMPDTCEWACHSCEVYIEHHEVAVRLSRGVVDWNQGTRPRVTTFQQRRQEQEVYRLDKDREAQIVALKEALEAERRRREEIQKHNAPLYMIPRRSSAEIAQAMAQAKPGEIIEYNPSLQFLGSIFGSGVLNL